ncbi:MAG: hypothetical protein ACFCGT_07165 [Sandaracinaceae bacterium]
MGIMVALVVAAGCAKSLERDELGPLEVRRTTDGRRLAALGFVLPDGTREEQRLPWGSRWLFDRALDHACRETDRTTDGRLRCLADGGFAAPTLFEDEGCGSPVVPAAEPGCAGEPRYGARSEPTAPDLLRSVRAIDGEVATPRFRDRDRGCVPFAGAVSGRYVPTEPVPEGAFVAGEETTRPRSPGLAEVTRRYEDGTVVRQRVLDEACHALSLTGDRAVRFCVPGPPYDSLGAPPAALPYGDAGCSARVLPVYAAVDPAPPYVATRQPDRSLEVREVLGEARPYPDGLYERDPDGSCQRRDAGGSAAAPLALPLGPVLAPSTFVRLERVALGTGRLRRVRWVDEAGLAWPVLGRDTWLEIAGAGFGLRLYDAVLDVECTPWQTVAGLRCLPYRSSQASPSFADPSCVENVVAADWTYLVRAETVPDPDACAGESLRFTTVHPLGEPFRTTTYYRDPTGACVTHEGEREVRRVLDPVPLESFAEVGVTPEG